MYNFIINLFEVDENIYEENNEDVSFTKYNTTTNNNNDAFQFLLELFSYFIFFFHLIYKYISSFIISIKNIIFRTKILIFLMFILFRFSLAFEDNLNITTDLIISSYFSKKNITRITYEMIQQKDKKELTEKQINKDENKKIDINKNTCNDNLNNINRKFDNNIKDIYDNHLYLDDEEKEKMKQLYLLEDLYINNKNKNNKNNLFIKKLIKNIPITMSCLLLLIFYIKSTFKRRKGFFILYFICLLISYNLMNILYQNEYILASNFIYIFLIYTNKKLIDSLYLIFKYKRKDFEIFTTNLIAINPKQFLLKFIVLVYLTIFSSIFSILLYRSWLNYIIYYLCLLNALSFLGNCIELIAPYYLKPIKSFILFFVGTFNLFLSKLFDDNKDFKENSINFDINNFKFDSFYLINDFFSLFCLNYIKKYIDYQIRLLSIKNNDKIIINICNYLTLFFFLFSGSIASLGIFKNEFIPVFISLYMARDATNYIFKFFNHKKYVIMNYLVICYYLILIPRMFKINDYYLTCLFLSLTHLNKNIFLFLMKSIILLSLINNIIKIHFILYDNFKTYKEKLENNDGGDYNYNEKNKYFYINEFFFQFFSNCLISIIYLFFEKNLIIKLLFIILAICLHLIKMYSIYEIKENSNNNESAINYHFYIFIWIIISLRLIEISKRNFCLLHIVNHLNAILIINFYIFSEKNKNITNKFIIILSLIIWYYRLNSCMLIVYIFNVIIGTILKNNFNYYIHSIKRLWNIKENNKLIVALFLSLVFYVLIKIIIINNDWKYHLVLNVYIELFNNENDINKKDEINKNIEFAILSKLL